MEPAPLRRLAEAMPKAELHLHLDGSLRPQTALELARTRGVDAPATYEAMFAALVAPEHPGSQAELLAAFDLPIKLLQDAEALERVTVELVEDKAAENVRLVEIKWAPSFHLDKGLTRDEVIAAVCRGAREGERRTGVVARACVVAARNMDPAESVEVAHAAVRFRDEGVTGFDLAGLEAAYPDPRPHREAFDVARAGGLGITVHAGELRDGGEGVRNALELDPSRIAHGVTAIEDDAICRELIDRRITLDLCPTSNVQAAAVDTVEDHPLARLHRLGVPVTLNSDDLTVSDLTLSEEFVNAVERIGVTLPELWTMNLHAVDVAFVDDDARARLRTEFTGWAAGIPELAEPS